MWWFFASTKTDTNQFNQIWNGNVAYNYNNVLNR